MMTCRRAARRGAARGVEPLCVKREADHDTTRRAVHQPEESDMCLNCGCGTPDDRHGDDANITTGDLRAAAEANGQSLDETVRNVRTSLDQVSQGEVTSTGS